MASSKPAEISTTELELKRRGRRRLIGAITLGLIAVVFLPMIFDSEPKRTSSAMKPQEISVQLPSKEGQPALPAPSAAPVVPVAPATVSEPVKPPVAVAEAVKEPPKEAAKAASPAVEAAKPAPKTAEKTASKPEKVEKVEAKPSADKKGFVVQLGVFGDADNAKQAIGKMKDAKLPVYTESIPIKSGTATRVRVGPYATKEKADAALAQVKLAGTDGKIVPLK
ncbi:MAG: SPOR domain-containing protein [Betaproteobacteria bacterium]|nr:SPOR domain-containing protein [Betaproteobacteria bacterium]